MKYKKFWGRFIFIPVIFSVVLALGILYNGLYRLGFFEIDFSQLDSKLIIKNESHTKYDIQEKPMFCRVLPEGAGNIDINNSSFAELDTLPGIGEVRAENIIKQRIKMGGFSTLQDLVCTEGIGPDTFEKIKPYIRISEYKGND
ncbi:MAG: helix-hairpin-helix domain-containing protein [Clostridia bacterium]|nr:helix-hairpin-helix domain-containing protein [Clostridia bacterium]